MNQMITVFIKVSGVFSCAGGDEPTTVMPVSGTVFIIGEEVSMQELTFEEVQEVSPLDAPQGPGTNALVHNPFAWDEAK
jgi:hypothetical protein